MKKTMILLVLAGGSITALGQTGEGEKFFNKFERDVKFCLCDYKYNVEKFKKEGLYNGTRIDGLKRRRDACIKNHTKTYNAKYDKMVKEVTYAWMKKKTGPMWGLLKKTTTTLNEAYVKDVMSKCD